MCFFFHFIWSFINLFDFVLNLPLFVFLLSYTIMCIPKSYIFWQHWGFVYTYYIHLYTNAVLSISCVSIFVVDSISEHDKDSRKLNAAIRNMCTRFLFWNVTFTHTCIRDRMTRRHHFGFFMCMCIKSKAKHNVSKQRTEQF